MKSSAILSLQTGLAALGFDLGRAGADGIDGPATRKAALAFGSGAAPAPALIPAPPTGGAMIYQGSAKHPVREIALHCSATRPDWFTGKTPAERRAEIKRWHVEDNGWNDFAYHWLIDRDGTVMAGRAETTVGAGIAGHNSGVIHICLIGGFGSAETDRFDDHFTPAQRKSVLKLIGEISERTQIAKITGHNQYAAKACPGFNVPNFLKENAA